MEGSEDETESSPLVRGDATGQNSRRTRRQRDQTQREDNFSRKKGWLSYFYSLCCCQWKSKPGSTKTPNMGRICMAVGALIALVFLGYIAVIGIEYEVSVFSGDPSPTPSPTVSMFPSTTPVETFSPSAFSGSSTLSPSTSPASSDDADDDSDDHASDDDDDVDDSASSDDDEDDDDDDDHASDDDDDKVPSDDDDDDDDDHASSDDDDDDDDDDDHVSLDDDDDDDDDDDHASSGDDDDDDHASSGDDDDDDHASSGDDDDDYHAPSGDDDADDHASDDTPPLSFPTVSGVFGSFPPTLRQAWGGEPTTRPSFPPGPTYRPSLRPSEGSRTRIPTVAPTILADQRTRQPTRSGDDDSPTGQPSIADKSYYPTVTTSPPSSQSPVMFVSNP